MRLFATEKIIGIFKGFNEGGLEFHADIVLKYDNGFQNVPMHGQFLIVELEGEHEAVLGRITSLSAMGRLSGPAGEDYALRAITDGRTVSEDLREGYLKYKVDIRVLGIIRSNANSVHFAPSHRRLPHVGSRVAWLSDELLQEVAGHNIKDEKGDPASSFGYLAYGEFIFTGGKEERAQVKLEDWMMPKNPEVLTKFRIDQLVSRRSFVFARAGFGKSNLVKLLFSNLYAGNPQVPKRGGRLTPVGTIIFDPDGEYFWPDDSGRPGLCDVPHLEDKVVVFTNKVSSSKFYQSFVADSIKLDIRRLQPSDVISIALPPEKQSQQNVQKLKALGRANWVQLVDLIYKMGNTTPLSDLRIMILGEDTDRQDAEIIAIRSNMTTIVRLIHDPSSQMMDKLFDALRNGKLCVVDISQMRGANGLILSGIILQRIFDHNQEEFTKAEPNSIPTIAVLEEAQSVLGGSGGTESPYIAWVKEGRKFSLGAVLITQQPGSISDEILSQGDNWFIFHLLSAVDLVALRKANAHFSNDLLSSLLNEPIPGNGIFWSSTGGKPYPISVRVLSFEKIFTIADKEYNRGAGNTFGQALKEKFAAHLSKAREGLEESEVKPQEPSEEMTIAEESPQDVLEIYVKSAFKAVKGNARLMDRIKGSQQAWMGLQMEILHALPAELEGRDKLAYEMVSRFMNEEFGKGRWETYRKDSVSKPGATTAYFKIL